MSRRTTVFSELDLGVECYSRAETTLRINLNTTRSPELSLPLLGVLPLIFFLAQAVHYWRINELAHMLWMCNIGNLLLAVGLFLNQRQLMRIAIIWTIPGLVIWFVYVVLAWGVFFTSTLAHVGGLVVGMIVLRQIGMTKRIWLYAFGWYLAVQFLSRWLTAPRFNVNLAHHIQPGWEAIFGYYWQFWIVLTIVVGVTLWLLEKLFRKLWVTHLA